jgi:nucleotide-binding universal stress UspA family protein
MYKKILVPVDGSQRAEAIISHVEQLVEKVGGEIILLRVFEPDFSSVDIYGHPPEFYESLHREWIEEIESYLANTKEVLERKGLHVRTLIETGSVVRTIIRVAEREGVDLIAMSSHGRTGLASVFYGSVAAGVLHQVDRPLLLIRSE